MDKLVYVAMTGADQTLLAQAVNANNLANVGTNGFRADLEQISSLEVFGDTHESRVFSRTSNPTVDFRPGGLIQTNRALDIAINGQGWIAVEASDAQEAYTRSGSLKINDQGGLVTGNDLPVMGQGGPIFLPPFKSIDIAKDGTLTISPLEDGAQPIILDQIKLVNPPEEELTKGEDGLFRLTSGEPAEGDIDVNVQVGFLESSNVNAVQAMTKMISLARQFEIQLKMMSTAEKTDEAATKLLSLS